MFAYKLQGRILIILRLVKRPDERIVTLKPLQSLGDLGVSDTTSDGCSLDRWEAGDDYQLLSDLLSHRINGVSVFELVDETHLGEQRRM